MNIVLYTNDFEPITVLDLPMWLLKQLETRGSVRIAVLEPTDTDSSAEPEIAIVTVYTEKLQLKDGTEKVFLVTDDEELALVLNPDWLPGQLYVIQSYESAIQSLKESLARALKK